MNTKLICFDLDGTLLNTLDDLADAMNLVLARWALPTHPVSAYRYFVGNGIETMVRRALPAEHRDDEAEIVRGAQEMRAEYGKRLNAKTRPYPGIPTLLDALVDQKQVLAILSNKVEALTLQAVDALLPGWPFAQVRGARKDVPPKPDPAGLLAILEDLNTPPEACVFVGDTHVDMKTANAVGALAVGVLWGFRDREELEAAGANHVIAKPEELLTLV